MYLALLGKDELILFYSRLQLTLTLKSVSGIKAEIDELLIFDCFLALAVQLNPIKFVVIIGVWLRAETARVVFALEKLTFNCSLLLI